ncbi:CBASS oligonucleotide cyclase [Iningainema tapete]|uniref:Nucleotidyltransferase n=1 Tax=Iningainema tapete BLCC-T55 TaxID=2748662 RepID=A0A8J6XD27_9CYAN|nr:CBASS oligonucleotide cyclase [Iningainema tapete]MBD2770978.1 nucleotidyltransferase [Iningainema tapete BLCC-T55]
MGGSGGSYSWSSNSSSEEINQLLGRAGESTDTSSYNSEVNSLLQSVLKDFNDRDAEATQRHLDILKKAIESEIENSVDLLFGGSIRKNTFINGLSDADTLVLVNNTSLEKKSPQEVLDYFAQRIQQRLPNTHVSVGKLAVTVRYSDGQEIQILPVIRTVSGLRISNPEEGKWSNVVRPDSFARKLTAVNKEFSGKVVPTIKLFKAVVKDILPKDLKISGYHAESLAIEAFKGYQGSRTYKDMLTHLCREATNLVKSPIKDKTGQSLHVDDSLGEANSQARTRISAYLERLTKKIEASDKLKSKEKWLEWFGE